MIETNELTKVFTGDRSGAVRAADLVRRSIGHLSGDTKLYDRLKARDDGRCVVLSTHIMREAEKLCDRLGSA